MLDAELTSLQATTYPCEEETTFGHILGGTSDQVEAQGPSAFQSCPAHQFFARLWRPLAVSFLFIPYLQRPTASYMKLLHRRPL